MPTIKRKVFTLGCLLTLASAPFVQTVAQTGQYVYDVQDGEADIFGQLRYEKNVNGTGFVKFNTANPNTHKWVRDYGYKAGVTPITTAGTYVGNEYYAYETTLYENTLMPRAISVVDVNTGEYTAKREIVNSTTEAPLILDEMTSDITEREFTQLFIRSPGLLNFRVTTGTAPLPGSYMLSGSGGPVEVSVDDVRMYLYSSIFE